MTEQEKFYSILNKLVKDNSKLLELNHENKVSSVLLFKDYIFRLRLWKNQLNAEYIAFSRKINFDNHDLINNINTDWKNEIPSLLDYYDYLMINFNVKNIGYKIVNYIYIYMYVCWEVFKDKEEIRKHNLSNPYEGLLKLFVRDYLSISEGVNIGHVTTNHNKCINFYLPSLIDEFLDYIDLKFRLLGSDGIPNQEEINQVWEEFQEKKLQ